MPKRTIEQPVTLVTQFQVPKGLEGMKLHAAGTLGAGMVTSIDPADIKDEACQLLLNERTRFDKPSRRVGSILATPPKPNTSAVIRLAYVALPDGATDFDVRITPSTVHFKALNGAWQNATGGILHGGVTDRISDAVIILPTGPPYYVFANNGVNEIQKVDFAGVTFGDLRAGAGVSTKYRYITGFYNRIWGFALAGVNECQLGWSGDGNITVFDPAVDSTAGNTPLIDSPDDETDFIKGGFGFTNIMLILRQRSIWHGTKLPIPTNPVSFYAAIPGIGCDCPYSARVTTEGIAWVDTATGTVWSYTPGKWPEPIGRPIEKSLINAIADPNLVFASYNRANFEYTVCIAQPSSTDVLCYTYNFRNNSWVVDNQPGVTAIADMKYGAGGLSISQLVGTISGLQGTIQDLGKGQTFNTRLYGRQDGEILIEHPAATMDGQTSPGDTSGVAFESDIISKSFELAYADEIIAKVRIDYICQVAGNMSLWYSKSGGLDNDWILAKTISITPSSAKKMFMFKKGIKTSRFAWKLSSTLGQFDVTKYEVHYFPGAEART